MQADFWRARWRGGQIGFHQAAVERCLSDFWPALERHGGRVLVPLCGKSLDMLWLRDRGHCVVGVELSDIALECFCLENGVPARRRQCRDADVYEAPGVELHRRDWFSLTPAMVGSVEAVYDRAALLSWAPDQRSRYVELLTALTQTGTDTLLITLEYRQDQMAGPPFSVDAGEVGRLYGATHRIRELARRDVLANEPRMRAKGVTRVSEVCYRLTRL